MVITRSHYPIDVVLWKDMDIIAKSCSSKVKRDTSVHGGCQLLRLEYLMALYEIMMHGLDVWRVVENEGKFS